MINSEVAQLVYIPQTDSTNNFVKNFAQIYPQSEFVVAYTNFQTSGRGQRGNSWESEQGKNLLFSLLCRPTFMKADRQFALSQAISLSIKEELDTIAEGFRIKWPNDIYWHERKIGGILIENELNGRNLETAIIGVGLNLNQHEFLSDAPNPVSLWQITGTDHDATTLLERIIQRFYDYYQQIKAGTIEEIDNRYRHSLLRAEGYYRFRDEQGEFEARIHHIEPDGRLVLEDKGGQLRTYNFKEVVYIFPTAQRLRDKETKSQKD